MKYHSTYFNFSFSFRFCGVKFIVDIDESFSAQKLYGDSGLGKSERPLHYHTKEELFFVFDKPLSVESEGERHEFKNAAVFIPPFLKHRSAREGDFRILYSYEIIEQTDFAVFLKEISEKNSIISVKNIKHSLSTYLDDLFVMMNVKEGMVPDAADSILKILFYQLFSENGGKAFAEISPRQIRGLDIRESYESVHPDAGHGASS